MSHVAFSVSVQHPAAVPKPLDPDIMEAIAFECGNTAEEIHTFRTTNHTSDWPARP